MGDEPDLRAPVVGAGRPLLAARVKHVGAPVVGLVVHGGERPCELGVDLVLRDGLLGVVYREAPYGVAGDLHSRLGGPGGERVVGLQQQHLVCPAQGAGVPLDVRDVPAEGLFGRLVVGRDRRPQAKPRGHGQYLVVGEVLLVRVVDVDDVPKGEPTLPRQRPEGHPRQARIQPRMGHKVDDVHGDFFAKWRLGSLTILVVYDTLSP